MPVMVEMVGDLEWREWFSSFVMMAEGGHVELRGGGSTESSKGGLSSRGKSGILVLRFTHGCRRRRRIIGSVEG